jgi:hypothetical protein
MARTAATERAGGSLAGDGTRVTAPGSYAQNGDNRRLTPALDNGSVCGKWMSSNGTSYRTCLKPPGHAGNHRRYPPSPRARTRRYKDNGEYARMMRRLLRAYGERMVLEDPGELRALMELHSDVDAAIDRAARAFYTGNGGDFSWGEIGRQLGISRQAAQQRWGKPG